MLEDYPPCNVCGDDCDSHATVDGDEWTCYDCQSEKDANEEN